MDRKYFIITKGRVPLGKWEELISLPTVRPLAAILCYFDNFFRNLSTYVCFSLASHQDAVIDNISLWCLCVQLDTGHWTLDGS